MRIFFCFLLCMVGLCPQALAEHALSLGAPPKYGPGFTHFAYVQPDAPKGGEVRLAAQGSFDSLNPFLARGNAADGLGLLFDTLTTQSLDEPFAAYGLLAEEMEILPAGRGVVFFLRPEARFHNGTPVLAKDVAWSFRALIADGSPLYAQYYADVETVEAPDARTVRFLFKPGANRELPLILGQLPVFCAADWEGRAFGDVSLRVPVGSGPYRLQSFRAGQSLCYVRDREYWGRDLPVNKGRYNFDRVRYEYYRDQGIALEAFKAGNYDFRQEYIAKQWATGYESPALRRGLICMERIAHQLPQGMQGFVFNTRLPLFADARVRKALTYAFDFTWCNEHLFYGEYTRSRSYFSNSPMASSGLPGPGEKALLAAFRLPEEVLTQKFLLPGSDGSLEALRGNLLIAARLLREAGWEVQAGRLMRDGRPFEFEMLLAQQAFERVALPFARNLARLGITMHVRLVDSSQYLQRLRHFDYAMIVSSFGQSLSPGNEQRSFWSTQAARTPGSRNYCGIANPAVDKLVEEVIAAPDREALLLRCRALDRALLWGWYVIPHWHLSAWRVAYWDKFSRPEEIPPYGLDFFSWWVDPHKDAGLRTQRRKLENAL